MQIVKKPKRTMILRVGLGDGEVDGEKFSVAYDTKGLVWYFSKEERYYTIDFESLTKDVLKFRERKV